MPRPASIAELEGWERNGAVWRTTEISEQRAVVELCTCSGELMDVLESEDRDLIEFVRAHRED